MNWARETIRIALSSVLLLAMAGILTAQSPEMQQIMNRRAFVLGERDYGEYRDRIGAGAPKGTDRIELDAASFDRSFGNVELRSETGGERGSFLFSDERSFVSWDFTVETSGLYNISVRYFPISGKTAPIEREILIDGQRPFREARSVVFQRVWSNRAREIASDNRGNELRPVQVEAPRFREVTVRDLEGYYSDPYQFYLEAGEHTLTFAGVREPIVYDQITIHPPREIPTYEERLAQYEEQGLTRVTDVEVKIQAEEARRKSDPSLYPIFDRSSPATEPNHVYQIRLNTIGGTNWRFPGQWITWEVDVPETGLYEIALKYRQNQVRGVYSNRTIYINGAIPFQEAQQTEFQFDRDWVVASLGAQPGLEREEPYLFYLEEGTNTITLETSLGEITGIINQIESSVFALNNLYRTIVMITGTTPDPFRDYRLEEQIPNLMETLEREKENVQSVIAFLEEITGETGGQAAVLARLVRQIEDMVERPETIPDRLEAFNINVGALSAWLFDVRQLPLELDYLLVQSPGSKLPRPDAGFFQRVSYNVGAFFSSFFVDYNTIGNVTEEEEAVELWLAGGRQQAQIMKALIDESFSPDTGISVNLKIVDQQIVLPSILSGRGPDIVSNQRRAHPVDYALRNGVQDLSAFEGFQEVSQRFHESAMTPFHWDGGVYALPETQLFDVMFYRADVMEELGLELPETWEEVYELIPELQKQNLDFGMPFQQFSGADLNVQPINQAFAMFLFQNGGDFYEDDGRASALDSEFAVRAFRQWTDLYTSFRLPLEYALQQRFRTGEMPVGITYFNYYNVLTVFAPELRGLWNFAPVPGIRNEDGSVSRQVSSEVTAAIMLEDSTRKEQSWEYLKWWTSAETQADFGREMESILGPAARYPTANQEALSALAWPIDVIRSLQNQWDDVRGIPETPGGYFTGRHLENAFRNVVFEGEDPRETLLDFVDIIDEEILIKRQEFGLDE